MANRKRTHDALPLRTVARLTGLTPDVIRAWEKRYGAVSPQRGPRGARVYADADVQRLRLLREVTHTGRAIGDIARLNETELSRLAAATAASKAHGRDAAAGPLLGILASIEAFDADALHQRLSEALVALGAREFRQRVAAPLLEEVGTRWADGRFSIADEHLLSTAVRNLLAGLARLQGAASGPRVLLATPSGERHELGLLLAALGIADAGLAPFYLGPDLPADEIVTAARRARVAVVGLAVVNGENDAGALDEVRRVERGLAADTELWLGGRHAADLARHLKDSRARVVHDGDVFERALERVRMSPPHRA